MDPQTAYRVQGIMLMMQLIPVLWLIVAVETRWAKREFFDNQPWWSHWVVRVPTVLCGCASLMLGSIVVLDYPPDPNLVLWTMCFGFMAHPNRGCRSWGLKPPVSSRLRAM